MCCCGDTHMYRCCDVFHGATLLQLFCSFVLNTYKWKIKIAFHWLINTTAWGNPFNIYCNQAVKDKRSRQWEDESNRRIKVVDDKLNWRIHLTFPFENFKKKKREKLFTFKLSKFLLVLFFHKSAKLIYMMVCWL